MKSRNNIKNKKMSNNEIKSESLKTPEPSTKIDEAPVLTRSKRKILDDNDEVKENKKEEESQIEEIQPLKRTTTTIVKGCVIKTIPMGCIGGPQMLSGRNLLQSFFNNLPRQQQDDIDFDFTNEDRQSQESEDENNEIISITSEEDEADRIESHDKEWVTIYLSYDKLLADNFDLVTKFHDKAHKRIEKFSNIIFDLDRDMIHADSMEEKAKIKKVFDKQINEYKRRSKEEALQFYNQYTK